MTTSRSSSFVISRSLVLFVAALVGLGSIASGVTAAERQTKTKSPLGKYNPDDETVDLFQGMKDGQLEVKFIPKDSTQANVQISNKSKKPLNVKLPEAFAAAPVLAQMGGGMGGGRGNNMVGGGGMGQGMGGGMGGGMMGGGGMGGGGMGGGGMGGGMFNVPAEKVGKFKVACVCLEHGKAEPRAAIPYRIMPMEEFTTTPGVREICTLLGYGKVNQRVAQVSAWNLNNAMSLDTLAAKRIEHLGGASEPYFSEDELRGGMALSSEATVLAEQQAKDGTRSLSQASNDRESATNDTATAEAQAVADDQTAPRRKQRAR